MVQAHLDIKQINKVKDLLLRLLHGESEKNVQEDVDQHIQYSDTVDILLILQELKAADNGITMKEIKKFFDIYHSLYGQSLQNILVTKSQHPSHPIQIFNEENRVFERLLTRINCLLKAIEKDSQHPTDPLIDDMNQLGQMYSHYNRKEKLFFPILERYRIYTPTRTMWADDDRIRTLYKGAKRIMEKIPHIDFPYVKQAYQDLEKACHDMIQQEEYFLLPIAQSIFKEADWSAIAKESKAFGFAINEPDEDWIPENKLSTDDQVKTTNTTNKEHLRFGGGYLTLKEANHILNNLPLEITFVDKNGIFKYFNEIVESSKMMFIRTPISIGRNVANCHPPKSLQKVMQVIRDLKTKKRSSETMWFKKKDQYIHVTYKGVFDEDGEYLGILEYVQDIQPFLDLPCEVKRGLSVDKQ
ncbi:DUF438 domain-containing protein [Oceanobacillus senegalensis]|uniref:DUF438 domain-containing protein n=1 Tax=Oceanobacillus senegalensis TaxID=1936063 RepID=UPI000A30529C|nr:PAS domain-containing protein [Oceanobacillus senegalensis]